MADGDPLLLGVADEDAVADRLGELLAVSEAEGVSLAVVEGDTLCSPSKQRKEWKRGRACSNRSG